MQADIRQQLSQGLAPTSEHYAHLVTDPLTQIEVYPTHFLKHYQIYQVEYFSPHKPILFYVGFALGQSAYLLTGAPENYVKLAQADNVFIDSPDIAVNYATVYLEVTRFMSILFYLVHSVEEVRFRRNLSDEEAKIKSSFMEKYRSVITSPTANSINHSYIVAAFAVREQSLERYSISVSRDGNVSVDVTTLEQDLPLVYGL